MFLARPHIWICDASFSDIDLLFASYSIDARSANAAVNRRYHRVNQDVIVTAVYHPGSTCISFPFGWCAAILLIPYHMNLIRPGVLAAECWEHP